MQQEKPGDTNIGGGTEGTARSREDLRKDPGVRAAVARTIASEWKKSAEIPEDKGDEDLLHNLQGLFVQMYVLHSDGKYLSATQAAEYTVFKHPMTSQKYIDDACAKGYISRETSAQDARKVLLKPTPKLITYVESELDRELEERKKILS